MAPTTYHSATNLHSFLSIFSFQSGTDSSCKKGGSLRRCIWYFSAWWPIDERNLELQLQELYIGIQGWRIYEYEKFMGSRNPHGSLSFEAEEHHTSLVRRNKRSSVESKASKRFGCSLTRHRPRSRPHSWSKGPWHRANSSEASFDSDPDRNTNGGFCCFLGLLCMLNPVKSC